MGLFERLRPHPGWKDPDPRVRRDAVRRLADPALLAELCRSDPDGPVRETASAALLSLALEGPHDDAALSALEHLTGSERFALPGEAAGAASSPAPDADFLNEVAGHGKSRAVVRRARALLHDRQEAAAGLAVSPKTDRRR